MNISRRIEDFISSRKNSVLAILLILLVGCVSLTWFRGDFLINQGDQLLPLSPVEDFKTATFYTWDHLRATGFVIPPGLVNASYFGLMALFQALGFSLAVSEKILYYLMFTLPGLSVYFLIGVMFPKNRNEVAKLGATFFYMVNFYPVLVLWIGLPPLGIFYAILPLLLGLFVKLIKDERANSHHFGLVFLLAILTSAVNFPTYVIIVLLVLLSYLLFSFGNLEGKRKIVLLSVAFVGVWLLLNNWWIQPLATNLGSFLTVGRADNSREIFEGLSSQTSFLNLFRLLGYPTFFGSTVGDPYFTWAPVYLTFPFLLLGFIPPVLAFLSFLTKQRNKNVFYFGFLAVLGLFLMKGVHGPFSGANRWMLANIPYFEIFRNSYEKFGVIVALSLAVMVGIGFGTLYDHFKKYGKRAAQIAVVTLFILLFGIYMWPYWTGDLIYPGGKIKPSARIRIPKYYYEAREWLKDEEREFRILSLPHQEGGVAYNWEHGYVGSADPTISLLQRPILSPFDPGDEIISPYLSNLFELFMKPKSSEDIARILGLTNIKYVLLHTDVNYQINTPNPQIKAEDIKSILDSQEGIHLEKSFGEIDFYKISEEYFLPHIYASPDKAGLKG